MHKNKPTLARMRKFIYLVMIAGLLSIFAPGIHSAYADNMPGGDVADPAVKNADITQPAVVRIITGITGHLKVHFSATNDVTFPQTSNNIYELRLSGTGTFISSHGDILTADHVVNPPNNPELNSDLYQNAAQDIATYMNNNATSGSAQVTQQQVVQQLTSGQLKSDATYDTPRSTVYMSTAYTDMTKATDTQSLPQGVAINVDKIEKESPVDQEDTAIIHVPQTDTLSVPLDNSNKVQVQDKLTIIGFPGNADISKTPDSLLTSSVNQIYVSSALKTNNNGAPLIQVAGNVEQGDSGGPALDSQGKIVGIVSFGVVSQGAPGGTSFLQASSSAQSMTQSLKLDTTPGRQQKLWTQAFNDYTSTTAGHWHKAQQDFAQLQQSYPNFKAIQPYYTYVQSQAKNETQAPGAQATATSTPTTNQVPQAVSQSVSWQAVALTIGAIVLLALLAVTLFMVTLRQSKKAAKPRQNKTAISPTPLHSQAGIISANESAKGDTQASKISPQSSVPVQATTPSTLALKAWPCGHMNRMNARFCNVCGEPAPTPPNHP